MTDYFYYLHQYFVDNQHWATKGWILSRPDPWQFMLIVVGYLLLVSKIIPKLMENRPPFVLRGPLLCYNVFMVIANCYFFYEALTCSNYGRKIFDYVYPEVDKLTIDDFRRHEMDIGYLYFMSKFLDWLDTIFFALRKKDRHISFLHLYHHSVVPTFGYLLLKINPFIPGLYLFGICNTFVHSIMYSYYALSSFGPRIQKYLWWKKYITQLQIGQLGVYACFAVLMVIKQKGYPVFWFYFGLTQPPFFLWMFYDFYRQSYQKKNYTNKKHDVNNNDNVNLNGKLFSSPLAYNCVRHEKSL